MNEPLPALRVLHVITDLEIGGAEIMLTRILPRLREVNIESAVVCLNHGGSLLEALKREDIPVTCLNMKPGRPSLIAQLRLIQITRAFQPDLIHSWLYHADLMASIAAVCCRVPIFWSIHNSEFRPDVNFTTRFVVSLLAKLSRFIPKKILSCSRTAASLHVQRGYRANKIVYLPNGFNTDQFAPDPAARARIRARFGIDDGTVLIGNVARFDPQKNHHGLIRAFKKAGLENLDAKLLLAGRNINDDNEELMSWIRDAAIEDRAILIGQQREIPGILNAIDVFVLPSISEAFPLALGEAMSCGCYCIATDVGDCSELLKYAGKIVRSAEELPGAIRVGAEMTAEERKAIGVAARLRIRNHYSIERMIASLNDMYRDNK